LFLPFKHPNQTTQVFLETVNGVTVLHLPNKTMEALQYFREIEQVHHLLDIRQLPDLMYTINYSDNHLTEISDSYITIEDMKLILKLCDIKPSDTASKWKYINPWRPHPGWFYYRDSGSSFLHHCLQRSAPDEIQAYLIDNGFRLLPDEVLPY
jgi:hypothetical protein